MRNELQPTGSEQKTFLGLLFKSRFSSRRLRQEMAQFQAVVREDVGQRVHLLALESPSGLRHALPSSLHALELDELQVRVAEALSGKPKTSSREAVVGVLLHRWINQLAPVKVPELAALSGASPPTVYAALTAIDPACLQRDEDRRLSLSGFSAKAWQLGRQDVAIGGVLGAKHHFPELDITAAPYLDVVVHGTQHTDLSFIGQLDPGLVRDDSAAAHGHVIVHFVNRPHSLFEMAEGAVWANVLDCLVNLWDADLTHQVEHLINHIAPGGLREPLGD